MRDLSYDVVPHHGGYAIVITPNHADAFATKHDAFDAAVEFARKLRFVGISVHVRLEHDDPFEHAKAS